MAALQTSFEDFIKIGNSKQCPLKLTRQNCCTSYLITKIPWISFVKAVAANLKLKLKEQVMKFCPEIMPCACYWRSQSFLGMAKFFWIKDVSFNGGWALPWMRLWNGAVKDNCCSRSEESEELGHQDWERLWGQKTLDMWANCVWRYCLPLKTFIPNFVAFLYC